MSAEVLRGIEHRPHQKLLICMYRSSHLQAAGLQLRHMLRSTTPLLACEVVAARLGLGNLAASFEENTSNFPAQRGTTETRGASQTAISRKGAGEILQPSPPEATSRTADKEGPQVLRGNPGGRRAIDGSVAALTGGQRALRHFLHAVHACPTASAAWLNASEVIHTPLPRGTIKGEHTLTVLADVILKYPMLEVVYTIDWLYIDILSFSRPTRPHTLLFVLTTACDTKRATNNTTIEPFYCG